jgi:hypothetical protein
VIPHALDAFDHFEMGDRELGVEEQGGHHGVNGVAVNHRAGVAEVDGRQEE